MDTRETKEGKFISNDKPDTGLTLVKGNLLKNKIIHKTKVLKSTKGNNASSDICRGIKMSYKYVREETKNARKENNKKNFMVQGK